MYELKDKIKTATATLKKQVSGEESLNLICLLEDAFDMILERNKELNEALDKLDMLSIDLVKRDTYRASLLRIQELEKENLELKSN
tara:strand:- start:3302 stop:3559 length:258 start_codon:yes stop_codon:yes gene_type:complete